MKINELFETVIDSEDKFKKKRGDDFSKKLQGIADDLPNVFRHQADLEHHVADELEKANTKFNKSLKHLRLKLGKIMKEYQPQTTVAQVIYFHSDPHDDHYEEIKAFTEEHGQEVLKALEQYQHDLDAIKNWSKEQKWPTGENSLMRYTKFGYAVGEVTNSMIPAIKELMKK